MKQDNHTNRDQLKWETADSSTLTAYDVDICDFAFVDYIHENSKVFVKTLYVYM